MNKDNIIELQNRAINKIEDYFEYRSKSRIDKFIVQEILCELSREIEIEVEMK